jgi:chemotaxis protein methyltransferase CheR
MDARVDQGPMATLGALSAACDLRLDCFRAEHVQDRIDRAIAAEDVADVGELTARLRDDPLARVRFRRSVAVSHSGFFRDAAQFDALEHRLLPRLLEQRARLWVWSAGCANGLELWTMAVVLARLGALDRAHLLGSDLLEENLTLARAGVHDIVELGASRGARPRWECRDLVSDPPPPGGWDCIVCRNVAIYLEPVSKARLHRMLAAALNPMGVLVLGRSERLADPGGLGLRHVEPHVYARTR